MRAMRASSGSRGSSPAASIAASSMQLAQKSPILRSSEPGAAEESAAAFSRTARSLSRFFSSRTLKEAQYDWSDGIGLFFSQPPLP